MSADAGEALAIAHRFDAMTLGEATRLLRAEPWACACIGDPYCCRHAFDHARRLQRAAHIVARLIADAIEDHQHGLFLLVCRACGDDLPIPFSRSGQRADWAAEHTRGTGHDQWWAHDGYMSPRDVRAALSGL